MEKIKSEDTYYKLVYFRLINPSQERKRGYATRNRANDDVQKDLELSNLKNRYLKKEFDAIEYNRRCAYKCHEYGESKKFTN